MIDKMNINFSNVLQEKFIINFLFSLLFFSFIAGNLIINLNIFLILIFGLIFYKNDIFKIKFELLDKLIISTFLYILLNGLFNNFQYKISEISYDSTVLIKSILYMRFLLLYFLINYLIKKDKFNFKLFFISSSFAVIFVIFDIFFQFYFGRDIFGFEGIERRLSGPFGDEEVAGSYIFRFGIFIFFLFPIFFNINKKYLLSLFLILFIFFFFSLVLSGNRTPFFLFLITLSCILLFEKKLRKFFLIFIPLILLLITLTYNFHQSTKDHLGSYKNKIKSFFLVFSEKNILSEEELEKNYRNELQHNMFYTLEYKGNFYKMSNTYMKEFKAGYITWKTNKFLGGGIKSFFLSCQKAKIPNCINHPHNYYLELLSELGLVGFVFFVLIFLIVFYKSFIIKYFTDSGLSKNYMVTPFIFLFFMEIFPIRNSGSFFSTSNATYFFLIMSILISLIKKQNLIEKKR